MAATVDRLTSNQPERVQILGFPLDRVTVGQTKDIFISCLRERFEKTYLILTADSNAFVSAENDKEYQRIFSEASLITPDSAGPVWALSRIGKEVEGRVSGVELLEVLCELSASMGASIYFLGSAPGVAELAVQNLKMKYPKMMVAGVRDGYFPKGEDQTVALEIAKSKPDILIVAMGMPRQELFILDTASVIEAKIGIGVGGSLDVHSGTVKRAPRFIQRIKMEWAWRFLMNPRKIAKVKNLPIFYWKVRQTKQP